MQAAVSPIEATQIALLLWVSIHIFVQAGFAARINLLKGRGPWCRGDRNHSGNRIRHLGPRPWKESCANYRGATLGPPRVPPRGLGWRAAVISAEVTLPSWLRSKVARMSAIFSSTSA